MSLRCPESPPFQPSRQSGTWPAAEEEWDSSQMATNPKAATVMLPTPLTPYTPLTPLTPYTPLTALTALTLMLIATVASRQDSGLPPWHTWQGQCQVARPWASLGLHRPSLAQAQLQWAAHWHTVPTQLRLGMQWGLG